MNRNKKKIVSLSVLLSLCLFAGSAGIVQADAVDAQPYLALGADLSESEKETVYELLGVDGDHLEDYKTVTITNQDEHENLDSYLSDDVIGSRALSCVLIRKSDEGEGIQVTTHNITYCSEGMYKNALTTAGITDAEVTVAGPFNITGTAALVGTMKAYEEMTGETLSSEAKDTATNELVLTGDLAESIGSSDTAEQFIAYLKEKVASGDLDSEEEIDGAIEEGCETFEIELTEEQKQEIRELLEKIDELDLDVEQLKEQAADIYEELKDLNIDSQGIFEKIISFLKGIISRFIN